MKRNKLCFPVSRIITFLFIISFFRPTIFEKYNITNNFFNALLVLSLFLCFMDIFRRHMRVYSIFLVFSMLFYSVMLVSTYINNASLSRTLMYVLIGLGAVIVAVYIIKLEFINSAKLMRRLLWLYLIINIITVIIFPNGITQTGNSNAAVYFLGQPTRYAYFYLPALLFCCLEDEYKYGHLSRNTLVLYIICLITLIQAWTVGSSLTMIFLGVWFFFHDIKLFNNAVYFVCQIGAHIGLVYYSIQDVFSTFITVYLHKDMTLSSRTQIWQHALNEIGQSPLWGVGVLDNESVRRMFGFVHPHNHLLQITFQCGYVGLIIFLVLIFISYKKISCCKNFLPTKIIAAFIFATGIQLLVDTVDGVRNHYIFLLAIGAYANKIKQLFDKKDSIVDQSRLD